MYESETNIMQEDKSEETSDKFPIQKLDQLEIQGQILAMSSSKNYVIFITQSDIYKWDRKSYESIQQAYSLKPADPNNVLKFIEKDIVKIWTDRIGNHSIIRHGDYIYYFNGAISIVREIVKLRGYEICSVAFDDKCENERNSGIILFSDYYNNIYQFYIEIISDKKEEQRIEISKIEKLCCLPFNNEFEDTEQVTESFEDSQGFTTIKNVIPKDKIISIKYFKTQRVISDTCTSETIYIIIATKSKFIQLYGTGKEDLKQIFYRFNRNPLLINDYIHYFPETGRLSRLESDVQILYKNERRVVDKNRAISVDVFNSFGWKTESGFNFGQFSYTKKDVPDDIKTFTIVPYVKIKKEGIKDKSAVPISVVHTNNHIFYLFNDCLTIISKLTCNIVYTEYFNQIYNNMLFDEFAPDNGKIILTSPTGLYEIPLKEECKDIWREYLEIGDFNRAINACKSDNELIKKINHLSADALLESGHPSNAAIQYSLSDEKFETVCLKYIMINDFKNLKTFIELQRDSKEKHLTQKTILTLWLVEIALSNEKGMKIEEFRKLIRECREYLDKETIYQLLQSYGKDQEFFDFASIMEDYETVILHYITQKQIPKALDELENFASFNEENGDVLKKLAKIFLENSNIFFKENAQKSIDLLKSFPEDSLSTSNVVKALINAIDKTNILYDQEAIKYVKEYKGSVNNLSSSNSHSEKDIEIKNIINKYEEEKAKNEGIVKFLKDKIAKVKPNDEEINNLHNLYIYYLSQNPAHENILIGYLKEYLKNSENEYGYKVQKKNPLFNLEYAQRIFEENNNIKVSAINLALMGKYSDGLNLLIKKLKELDAIIIKEINKQKAQNKNFELKEGTLQAIMRSSGQDEIYQQSQSILNIAKYIATNAPDEKTKKTLWLYLFDERKTLGFNEGLKIMSESKILKIQDVLSHITDDIKIEDFKSQISSCINDYEKNIQKLKEDIKDYNKTAENIKDDISKVKKKSMEIQYKQCKCELCQASIKDNNIYLFPCGHMFDAQCIQKCLIEYLDTGAKDEKIKEKIEEIALLTKKLNDNQDQVRDLDIIDTTANTIKESLSKGFDMFKKLNTKFNFFGNATGKGNEEVNDKSIPKEVQVKDIEKAKTRLNELLSEQCIFCGDYMVNTIQCEFKKANVNDWKLY